MLTPKKISFRDLLTFYFKWKYHIVLSFIVIFSTIIYITFSQVPLYVAKGQILVKIGSRDFYALEGSRRVETGWGALDKQLNTEVVFLKSGFLAEKVLNNLGPDTIYPGLSAQNTEVETKNTAREYSWYNNEVFQDLSIKKIKRFIIQDSTDNTVDQISDQITYDENHEKNLFNSALSMLQNALVIKGIQNSNIIEISFWHINPEMAATVVNTFMDIYLDERLKLQGNAEASTFFKDQSLELRDRLAEAENDLEEYKNKYNITDLEQQRRLLLQEISRLQMDLKDTSSKVIETESRIALIKDQLSRTPETSPEVVEQFGQNQYLMSQLEAKLVELQIEEKELLSKYTPSSRTVNNIRERIEIVENKIREQESQIVQRSSVSKNTTYQRLEEDLFSNQTDLEALHAKKEVLIRHLTSLEKDREILNHLETDLKGFQQSVDLYRENYKLYLAKLEASRIENAMDSEKINDVISMDRATSPLKPNTPRYKLNIILAILLGSTGALLFAISCDYLDDNLETPEDIENNLKLTVLTSIPTTKSRKRLDHRQIGTVPSDVGIRKL